MSDTITIPREEYETARRLLGATTDALNMAKAQIAHFTDEVALLKRMLFGRSSERLVDTPGDQPDLTGFEKTLELLAAPATPEPATAVVPEHTRKGEIRNKGKFQLEIPDDLPREDMVVDVPEAERTMADGTQLVKIGEDRVEKLAYRSGSYYMRATIYPRYAHPKMPSLGIIQEPAANGVFKGAKVDESLAAHLIAEKFGQHLPLYRQLERLKSEARVKMTRQHACSIIQQSGDACEKLLNEAIKIVLGGNAIHVDETGVKMLDPGAGQCQDCKVWVYAAGGSNPPPYAIFDFTTGRQQQFLFDVLKGYRGIVHADAYVAYENLETKLPNIKWAACWAHARRKFEECLGGPSDGLARWKAPEAMNRM